MKFIKQNILLLIIVGFAFLVRFVNVGTQPPSLNWDEVSHGYNAFSILKSGTDEWGELPVSNFRAYGDYPITGNLYLSIPFVFVFGLNAFAMRFPHVLLGVGTVIATYFLMLGITKKKNAALFTSFLVSIGPWYVFTSRFVLQSNLSVFFLTAAFASFFNREKSKYLLPLSLLLLGLTLFSYHTTRILSPLIFIAAVAIYRKHVINRTTAILSILVFLPLPLILLGNSARARANEVFLINPGVIAAIEASRNESTMSPLITKILYNRPVYVLVNASRNYIDYLSPQFLFFEGGTQYQFSVPHQGLLFPVLLPFFYIGIGFVLYKAVVKREKDYQLLMSWLLIAPIPAVITTERFAVLRASGMLPLPEILCTFGLLLTLGYLKRRVQIAPKTLTVGFAVVLIGFFIRYISVYSSSYRTQYSWAWQYGYEEIVDYANSHYDSYDTIITTKKYGEPHEFFLFYGQVDPVKYKSDPNLNRYTQSNWWWVDGFDKFVFVNDWEIPKEGYTFITESKRVFDCTDRKCLLITGPENAPIGWNLIKTVYFLDNSVSFKLYEN